MEGPTVRTLTDREYLNEGLAQHRAAVGPNLLGRSCLCWRGPSWGKIMGIKESGGRGRTKVKGRKDERWSLRLTLKLSAVHVPTPSAL